MSEHTSRYIIGIDLGTTNTAVSFIDTETKGEGYYIQTFPLLQSVSDKQLESRSVLPSILYISTESEVDLKAKPDWVKNSKYIYGKAALGEGKKRPSQLLHSAKSWLSNPQAARKDKILPLSHPKPDLKISPLEAQSYLLTYLKQAWNYQHGKENPFEDQEIVLTIPASFDEVARKLTVEAAQKAGCLHVTLLEEPQSAFYYWIYTHENEFEQKLKVGSTALVCDIGGGTTDFTLISITEKEGKCHFERNFVGQHLLLGGDNMDLALAFQAQKSLPQNASLEHSLESLKPHIQEAKENLLSDPNCFSEKITLFAHGKKLIGGSQQVELHRDKVLDSLLSGFFPPIEWDQPLSITSLQAVQTMGLPYAKEPAITKHLAHFLKKACDKGFELPSHVLFNGAALKAHEFQEAITSNLSNWKQAPVEAMSCAYLDLAVSRGAAYYGLTRRGYGQRISGGHATGYYIAVDSTEYDRRKLITLVPRGAESGFTFKSEQRFEVMTNTPVQFKLYASQTRLEDQPGALVALDETQFHLQAPMITQLTQGKHNVSKKIQALLEAKLTDVGTIDFNLLEENGSGHWSLAFQVRSVEGDEALVDQQSSEDQSYNPELVSQITSRLKDLFSQLTTAAYSGWIKQAQDLLKKGKANWSVSVIRACFDTLIDLAPKRSLSPFYKETFWNLAGFLLRPGLGFALDEVRIKKLWRCFCEDQRQIHSDQVQLQLLTALRRIAPGLGKGQQTTIYTTHFKTLSHELKELKKLKKIEIELFKQRVWLLTALELLDPVYKRKIARLLDPYLKSGSVDVIEGCIRLARRQPVFKGFGQPLGSDDVKEWAVKARDLINQSTSHKNSYIRLLSALTQHTGDPKVDLDKNFIDELLDSLQDESIRIKIDRITAQSASRTRQQIEKEYGESLPNALTLIE